MKDFFKYLTSSKEDVRWGIYLTVAGRYHSAPGNKYPSKEHPKGYFFSWERGRVLNEYQLVFIVDGSGVMEAEEGVYDIFPGTFLILQPGIKHKYRPNVETGWTEYFVGFNGKLAKYFMHETLRALDEPIVRCNLRMEFIDSYEKIFDLVTTQKPTYHQIASGMILKILGNIKAANKQSVFEGKKELELLINRSKAYMWNNVSENGDLKQFLKAEGVGYSYFRKSFKEYTGISPHQYFLDLKMMRAKELIVAGDMTIKEISYELGFDSIHYFSRLFKSKSGCAPSQYLREV